MNSSEEIIPKPLHEMTNAELERQIEIAASFMGDDDVHVRLAANALGAEILAEHARRRLPPRGILKAMVAISTP